MECRKRNTLDIRGLIIKWIPHLVLVSHERLLMNQHWVTSPSLLHLMFETECLTELGAHWLDC